MAKQTETYDGNYDDADDGADTKAATALLPKSILMGKECAVGDTLTFKVTAVRDGEVQVSPTDAEVEPEAPEAEEPEAEAEAMGGEEAPAEANYD